MSARILLVTGSRSLADTPAAEAWARAAIEVGLREYAANAVMHGGARGPDTWAGEAAASHNLAALVYYADGRTRAYGVPGGENRESWVRAGERAEPLLRNKRMVERAALFVDAGTAVLVLALTAPWGRTRGTQHTARHARAAGLHVSAHDCPAELGPVRGC